MQIALAMCDQELVQEWHLPDDFFADLQTITSTQNFAETTDVSATYNQSPQKKDPLNKTMQVFNETSQNISKTARLLGVSRNTVYKRLRDANIIEKT